MVKDCTRNEYIMGLDPYPCECSGCVEEVLRKRRRDGYNSSASRKVPSDIKTNTESNF